MGDRARTSMQQRYLERTARPVHLLYTEDANHATYDWKPVQCVIATVTY